jgi:Trypsin
MRAVRSFVGVVLTLGIIGWLNAAPSREVGSDVPDSSPMIQQVAPQNHEIAASTNWIKGMPTRSREIPHPALRVAQSEPDLSATGNPTIAPLKWAGLVLNYAAFEKDGRKYNRQCTGQFISPTVVLTAAHCVQDETGAFYDLKKMYFLLQYQNKSFSQSYRAICASRFDGWWPAQLRSQNTEERNRAEQNRWQWDYAMILVDRSSTTGYYQKWVVDWQGRYRGATATGYPAAMLGGEIIQIAHGDIFFPNSSIPNIVALRHNHADLTQGSSGGAWVANFDKREDGEYNAVIAVTSFIRKPQSGISFGSYPTSAFYRLFDYVSKGCSR